MSFSSDNSLYNVQFSSQCTFYTHYIILSQEKTEHIFFFNQETASCFSVSPHCIMCDCSTQETVFTKSVSFFYE